MAEFCTCRAELPPEARFCHKCGKPQRDDYEGEPQPEEAAPQGGPEVPKPPPAIDFRNSLAVRVGFLSGLLANLTILLPYLFLAAPLWLAGAGFMGVHLYIRRSGHGLSVRSGARMGWITGVFAFVIFTVFFTLNFLAAFKAGMFTDRERLSQVPFLQGNVDQVIELLQSPLGLAINLVFSLGVMFLLFAGFTMAGGALGARVLRKD